MNTEQNRLKNKFHTASYIASRAAFSNPEFGRFAAPAKKPLTFNDNNASKNESGLPTLAWSPRLHVGMA